jgi:hypothetical protein
MLDHKVKMSECSYWLRLHVDLVEAEIPENNLLKAVLLNSVSDGNLKTEK